MTINAICIGSNLLLKHPTVTMILLSLLISIILPVILFSILTASAVACIILSLLMFEGWYFYFHTNIKNTIVSL